MEKDQKVLIGLILFILVVALGIIIYLTIFKKDNSSNALKFKKEYESLNNKTNDKTSSKYLKVDIDKNNVFVYKTDSEIIDVIEKEDAIIYFGYKESDPCRGLVQVLNEVAKENNIKKVYYVDISSIRDEYEVIDSTISKIKNGTDSYNKLLTKLDEFLHEYIIYDKYNESYPTGEKRLFAPTVIAVKDKSIIGIYESVITENDSYELTDEQSNHLNITLSELVQKIN